MGNKAKEDNSMDFRSRAKQLQADIPAVFLALKDKRTPFRAKLVGVMAVGYALSPIDLIPDFIPVLGYLDDIILLPALIALTIRMIPSEVFEEHRERAMHIGGYGEPKKWYYAMPIFIFWLTAIFFLVKLIWL